MAQMHLRQADRLEITILVDNYTDLFMMENTEVVKRPIFGGGNFPLAEHGLAVWATVERDNRRHTILMDAGMSELCLKHNAKALGLDLNSAEGVVLSHGHPDHFGGLYGLFSSVEKGKTLVVHPHAFSEKRLNNPLRGIRQLPRLDEERLTGVGAVIQKTSGPAAWCSGLVANLGEIERVTDFETGFPWAESKTGNLWEVDPFYDDQGLAVDVKGKGLVVIGGCSHAGIINTVHHAKKVLGQSHVHAVLGGFHLTGPIFEPIISPTIAEMKALKPDIVVPLHCTGWNAINAFSKAMPEQFVLNSVGTTYRF